LPAGGARLGDMDCEAFFVAGDPDFSEVAPQDESEAIALNVHRVAGSTEHTL
jgi:hypothetical protein